MVEAVTMVETVTMVEAVTSVSCHRTQKIVEAIFTRVYKEG